MYSARALANLRARPYWRHRLKAASYDRASRREVPPNMVLSAKHLRDAAADWRENEPHVTHGILRNLAIVSQELSGAGLVSKPRVYFLSHLRGLNINFAGLRIAGYINEQVP